MSLSRALREDNDVLFQAALSHPFVEGIGNGSLPRDIFGRWIRQDWLYLQGYVEALERAAVLAPEEPERRFWQALSRFTQEEELALHRRLARQFDFGSKDLDTTNPYAATKDYLHTLRAAGQSYSTLIASLTPCAVGYAEIAGSLSALGACEEPDYAAWIDAYRAPAFLETVQCIETKLDRCGQRDGDGEMIAAAYSRAAQCELAFWEGLWRGH